MHGSVSSNIPIISFAALTCLSAIHLLAPTAESGNNAAQRAGYNGKIAYVMAVEGNQEIFVTDSINFNPVRLTDAPGTDNHPVWSPDGSKILFVSVRDGNSEIYVMNQDGSSQVNLTKNAASDLKPQWSPDGAHIYFYSNRSGDDEIYRMNADGGNQTRLTSAGGYNLILSRDGSKIYFTSQRDGSSAIYAMEADGANQIRLTDDSQGSMEGYLSINPNHNRLMARFSGDIYSLRTDGSDMQLLASEGVYNSAPIPSPDGSKILFTSNRSGDWELYVMSHDGTNQTRLTTVSGDDFYGSWSPDGQYIMFYSKRDGGAFELYRMRSDGSDQVRLTTGTASWSPAHTSTYPSWYSIPNTAPVATSDTLTTPYNTSGSVDVLANDTDEEDLDEQYLNIATQPLNGTASVVEGKVKYTPNDGLHGSDELTYQICDSFLLDQKCATGVLSITVQAPGAPAVNVTKVGELSFTSGTATYSTSAKRPTFSGTASPGSAIKVEIHSDPIVLTTTADDDGHWSVTPSADLPAGEHTVYITASLDGITTELDSFVLGITTLTELPSTGSSTWSLRLGGFGLLAVGAALHFSARRRARYTVPSLFP